jgi:DNA-directed RNA polymerase alpha subunit
MTKPRHPKLVRREAQAIDGAMDIKITGLPARILDELRNAGIYTIEQLQYLSEDELYEALRDVGCRAVDRVKDSMETMGQKGATIYDPNQ